MRRNDPAYDVAFGERSDSVFLQTAPTETTSACHGWLMHISTSTTSPSVTDCCYNEGVNAKANSRAARLAVM